MNDYPKQFYYYWQVYLNTETNECYCSVELNENHTHCFNVTNPDQAQVHYYKVYYGIIVIGRPYYNCHHQIILPQIKQHILCDQTSFYDYYSLFFQKLITQHNTK